MTPFDDMKLLAEEEPQKAAVFFRNILEDRQFRTIVMAVNASVNELSGNAFREEISDQIEDEVRNLFFQNDCDLLRLALAFSCNESISGALDVWSKLSEVEWKKTKSKFDFADEPEAVLKLVERVRSIFPYRVWEEWIERFQGMGELLPGLAGAAEIEVGEANEPFVAGCSYISDCTNISLNIIGLRGPYTVAGENDLANQLLAQEKGLRLSRKEAKASINIVGSEFELGWHLFKVVGTNPANGQSDSISFMACKVAEESAGNFIFESWRAELETEDSMQLTDDQKVSIASYYLTCMNDLFYSVKSNEPLLQQQFVFDQFIAPLDEFASRLIPHLYEREL